jgi:integrase
MPKLTSASVASLRPKASLYEISDNGSPLRLVVYPSGRRTWIVRYRKPDDGKSVKLTLGPHDESGETSEAPVIGAPLTLAMARQLSATALRQKAQGIDPAADKAARKRAAEAPQARFVEVAHAYLEHVEKTNRTAKQTAVPLNGIATVWGGRPLAGITPQDCWEMLERSRDGIPGIKLTRKGPRESRARLAYVTLSGLFSWAVTRRKIERSPMTGLAAPRPCAPRDRVLENNEIRALWHCQSPSPWHAACLRLLLATGQRLREISQLRWSEIVDGSIVLGPERTKNKRRHTVPLSSLALEILTGVPRVEGSPFVFSMSGRVPIAGWSGVKERLDKASGVSGYRLHDIRRTVATNLAKQGTPIHVTEKILGHTSGTLGGLVAVYQRYSYETECREALERWAATVRQIVGL